MWFLNSTTQSVGEYLAMQESRRASKRKSVHGSDIEPSSKKQKLLHRSLPPAPDQSSAHATTYQRPAEETPQLVYASLSSAQAQAHDGTNFRPSTEKRKVCHQSFAPAQSHDMANHALATQKLDIDHGSLPSALTPASAQAHDITDLGPATKKPKLSYASLPRTRVRASSVERAHLEAEHMRKSLRLWCRTRGHDFNLVDQRGLSDTALLSPNFDVCKLMAVFQSSTDRPCAYGPPELDSCPFDGSSAEKRSAENPKVDAHCVPEQELHDLSDLPSAPGIAAQTCPVSCEVSLHHPPAQCSTSRGRPESGEETSDSPIIPKTTAKESPAFGDNVDAACAPLDDQTSTPLSPINSTLNVGYNTRLASPDQIASAGSNPDMGDNTTAASSDQIASAGSNPDMGDNTTAASSDQIASAGSNPDMGDNTTTASSDQIAYLALNPDMRDNTTLASPDQIASAISNRKMGDNNTAASSDQIPSVASNRDKRDSTKAGSSYQIASVASSPDMRDDTTAASSDQNALPFPDSSLRDDTTLASPSEAPPFGPVRNQGGRPRGRKPRVLKTPKGPTRFQKNHPVKATLNIDVWENILLFCSPDFLLKARTISTTFRSILKNDSLIWKRARVNHFGPDMPDPPSDLSEPQYADLLTGNGCQTLGCESSKARKTYWAVQRRLCLECFHKAFLPPRPLRRVSKELARSQIAQYRSIAQYYRRMDEFLPGMKFDRWDNYQWLGNYDPTPSWGQLYRSGQYTGYPAAAYANFSSELAAFVGNEYDVEQGRFSSNQPLPGKTCPPQDAIDAWFEAKRATNDALVPKLQAVEDWCECHKRDNQKMAKDIRKQRESFYEEQAEMAGLTPAVLKHFKSYRAAIAISKPASMQSWKILLPKIMAEYEVAKKTKAEMEAEKEAEREREAEKEWEKEAEMEADRVFGMII